MAFLDLKDISTVHDSIALIGMMDILLLPESFKKIKLNNQVE